MSRRITVNVPDDVADRLGTESNVSAYVTEAVREKMRHERTRQTLTAAGFHLTDAGLDNARRRLAEGRAAMTPDVIARGRDLLGQLGHGE
jgi:hypothetical protein